MDFAILMPVQVEVIRKGHKGSNKPCSYKWVEGYQVIQPNGLLVYPYMRKREARAYCRDQGWKIEVAVKLC